jgi:putative lipoic acid-binding regulatory protein
MDSEGTGRKPGRQSDQGWWQNFKELLDDQNDWPTEYLFKFIVPRDGVEKMKKVFGEHPVRIRVSKKGNYASVTAKIEMGSSEEVVAIYTAAADVEGVLSL